MPRETSNGRMGSSGRSPATPPTSTGPAARSGSARASTPRPPAKSRGPEEKPTKPQQNKPTPPPTGGSAGGAFVGAAAGTILGGALAGSGGRSGVEARDGVQDKGPLYYGKCADYFVGLVNCADSHGGDLDLCRDILRDLARCSASE